MRTAIVTSVCECQARLGAELDTNRIVLRGWARDPRRGDQEVAPANSINPERQRFDIGWLCPFCTRNTLRSFEASALVYRETRAAS